MNAESVSCEYLVVQPFCVDTAWKSLSPALNEGRQNSHKREKVEILHFSPTSDRREPDPAARYHSAVNPLLLIIILLLLFGGGGFFFGGPAFGGGAIGLVLLICLIVYLMGGFRTRG